MELKRRFFLIVLCLILTGGLTACYSSKSFTFQMPNGEQIKVTLDTTDGYKLLFREENLIVRKGKEDLLIGHFFSAQEYEERVATVTTSDIVNMIEVKPEGYPTLYFYQFEREAGLETDFLFQIEDTETGVILGSLAPREKVEKAFKLLKFEKVE